MPAEQPSPLVPAAQPLLPADSTPDPLATGASDSIAAPVAAVQLYSPAAQEHKSQAGTPELSDPFNVGSSPPPPAQVQPLAPTEDIGLAPKPSAHPARLALILSLLVLVALGVEAAVHFLGQRTRLTATVVADELGRERLDLICSTCPNGTVVAFGKVSATFSGTRASISPQNLLPFGHRTLNVRVQLPGLSVEEDVLQLAAYTHRILPVTKHLQAFPPYLQFDIQVTPGTEVFVTSKPLVIGDTGLGQHRIDVSSLLMGPSKETQKIIKEVNFSIRSPELGTIPAMRRIAIEIAPLVIHAPGALAITDGDRFVIAGQTSSNAEVRVAGNLLKLDKEGRFHQLMSIDSVGETVVSLSATHPGMAPRTASFRVRRVESLKTEANRLARQIPRAMTAATVATEGDFYVTGKIRKVRKLDTRQVLTVDPNGACTQKPCTVELIYRGLATPNAGQMIRAFGRVNPNGTVPEAAELPGSQLEISLLLIQGAPN